MTGHAQEQSWLKHPTADTHSRAPASNQQSVSQSNHSVQKTTAKTISLNEKVVSKYYSITEVGRGKERSTTYRRANVSQRRHETKMKSKRPVGRSRTINRTNHVKQRIEKKRLRCTEFESESSMAGPKSPLRQLL